MHLLQFDIVIISFFNVDLYFFFFFLPVLTVQVKNDVLVVLNNIFDISAILQETVQRSAKATWVQSIKSCKASNQTHRGAFARWGTDFQKSKPANAFLLTNQGNCPFC